MDDDKTVIRSPGRHEPDADRTVIQRPGVLAIKVLSATGEPPRIQHFSASFSVGRAPDNGLVIDNPLVSRRHCEIRWENGIWWAVNLGSKNGIFLNGQFVANRERLFLPAAVTLGGSGITLTIDKAPTTDATVISSRPELRPVVSPSAHQPGQLTQTATVQTPITPSQTAVTSADTNPAIPAADSTGTHSGTRDLSPDQLKERLMAEREADDAGDYTKMVRRLIHEDRAQRGKSYKKVIWILASLFVVSIGLAVYQHIALGNARKLALDMFYDIKALEVSLAQADNRLEESSDTMEKAMETIASEKLRVNQEKLREEKEKLAAERKRMQEERKRLAGMKAKYRQYVEEANSLRLRFPTDAEYEEELIAKVARELGESELELPDGFVAEVKKYVGYWQNSSRLQHAVGNAEQGSFFPIVIAALQKQGLPVYFLYLPLQESNYDPQAIGPETRFGIAKGAWQLLATTAQDFGITPGPLANVREFDEQDPRFDFAQATQAGTKYLKRIYSKEAQASGLLVMASYNYGDTRVREMIKQMPDNPRDKNFWKFIQQYELPKETHDYVFYIFAAAVIGEDPKHFGFKFTPPLYELGEKGKPG